MYSKKIYMLLVIVLSFYSCKKEKIDYDNAPKIEFVSISPDPVKEYQPLLITFKYTDGDGDLGENDPNVKNMYVTDNRIGITYSYRIAQLSPDNTPIHISGKLEVKIDNAVITGSATTQLVNYSIYIVDRTGHQSNTISTGSVEIRK